MLELAKYNNFIKNILGIQIQMKVRMIILSWAIHLLPLAWPVDWLRQESLKEQKKE